MIRDIICMGVGFNPGSVKFMPTLGFNSSEPPPPTPTTGNRNNPMVAYLAIFMNR